MIPKTIHDTEILKKRAIILATEAKSVKRKTNELDVVIFKLAGETYGIELNRIRTIHPLKNLTYIPGVPEFISGIINLRGEIISVVDFKKFFDLPDPEFTGLRQVIILASDEMEFGVLADKILGVTQIPENEIRQSLPTLTGIRSAYLKGVTGDGIVILDGDKILKDKKLHIYLETDG